MDTRRGRIQHLGILALVIALHLTIGRLLLTSTRVPAPPAGSKGMEIVFIPSPVVRPSSTPIIRSSESVPARSPRPDAVGRSTPRFDAIPADGEIEAIHAPIDWVDELTRAARDAVPAGPANRARDFGFPHASPAPPPNAQEFGWSHARTHRVESIPGGGIIVNLNDNCVLVFNPLPFAGCALGKKKANGDLFKHMHDMSPAGPDAAAAPIDGSAH